MRGEDRREEKRGKEFSGEERKRQAGMEGKRK